MMRFGVCCGAEGFRAAAEAGYSYVETVFHRYVSMEEGEYRAILQELAACGLKSEACNCFFTSDKRLVGEDADHSFLNDYVNRGMERAAGAGCRVVVLGSGGARRIPEGFDYDRAVEQFCRVLTPS